MGEGGGGAVILNLLNFRVLGAQKTLKIARGKLPKKVKVAPVVV